MPHILSDMVLRSYLLAAYSVAGRPLAGCPLSARLFGASLLAGCLFGPTGCGASVPTPDGGRGGPCPDASPGNLADAGSTDTPDATAPVSVRIATWNVQNLFDERDDPERNDDVLSRSEVAAKLEALAQVLRAIDADLVGLQEVETLPLLERFADGPLRELGYTERGLIDSFDGRGIDVAYLSRLPVTMVASHLGERFPSADGRESFFWTRDALEVFVDAGGIPLTVMVVHFISRLDATNESRRVAEALAARDLVERRQATGVERMIVLGDMNDEPRSATLQALLEGPTLSDLTRGVPTHDRYTFVFRGQRRQVDFVLGTPNLEESVTTAEIRHDDAVRRASDHAPVIIDLQLR